MPYENEEPPFVEPDRELDALASAVIGAAIEVHRATGPGFARQVIVTVAYKNENIGERRLDFLVNDQLILEIKAVEQLAPIHKAQVNTYLKITGFKLGLLINFNVLILKDGIKRIVRG